MSSPAHELRLLKAISKTLHEEPDLDLALSRTLVATAKVLGLKTGWIWRRNPDTGEFYSSAAVNLPPYLQESVQMTGKSCWCIDCARNGELATTNIDLAECSRLSQAVTEGKIDATGGLRRHATIPLTFAGRTLGILNIAADEWRELSRSELQLLETVAAQMSLRIESSRLAEESLSAAKAEERARLSRDIHDTLAQSLTAIGLQIEAAMAQVPPECEVAHTRLKRALESARQGLDETRRAVRLLRLAPPDGKPLPQALAALARAFSSERGVRVHFRALGERTLPLQTEAELYCIAREALANVAKHAQASEVYMLIRLFDRRVRLTVRDNGGGFAKATSSTKGGLGITGMKERAKLLNGVLRIVERPGRGTTVTVSVPVTEDGEL